MILKCADLHRRSPGFPLHAVALVQGSTLGAGWTGLHQRCDALLVLILVEIAFGFELEAREREVKHLCQTGLRQDDVSNHENEQSVATWYGTRHDSRSECMAGRHTTKSMVAESGDMIRQSTPALQYLLDTSFQLFLIRGRRVTTVSLQPFDGL